MEEGEDEEIEDWIHASEGSSGGRWGKNRRRMSSGVPSSGGSSSGGGGGSEDEGFGGSIESMGVASTFMGDVWLSSSPTADALRASPTERGPGTEPLNVPSEIMLSSGASGGGGSASAALRALGDAGAESYTCTSSEDSWAKRSRRLGLLGVEGRVLLVERIGDGETTVGYIS